MKFLKIIKSGEGFGALHQWCFFLKNRNLILTAIRHWRVKLPDHQICQVSGTLKGLGWQKNLLVNFKKYMIFPDNIFASLISSFYTFKLSDYLGELWIASVSCKTKCIFFRTYPPPLLPLIIQNINTSNLNFHQPFFLFCMKNNCTMLQQCINPRKLCLVM